MLICTYWTDEKYCALAEACMESAKALGIATYGRKVEPQVGFYHSCREKPRILLEALAVVGETEYIAWVDADCIIRQYPEQLASGNSWDVAGKTDGECGVWGTVVGFRTTPEGMRVLRDWANYLPGDRDDEEALRRALFPLRDGCRLRSLPVGYVWTDYVHRKKFPGEPIIIEHRGVHMRLPKAQKNAMG